MKQVLCVKVEFKNLELKTKQLFLNNFLWCKHNTVISHVVLIAYNVVTINNKQTKCYILVYFLNHLENTIFTHTIANRFKIVA